MNVPDDLRYSTDHEWARLEDGRVRVGITDYAQDTLGDVVFVQVPEVGAAGRRRRHLRRGRVHEVGVTISTRRWRARSPRSTASSPMRPTGSTRTPTARAGSASSSPSDLEQLDALLDAEGYRKLIDG